LQRVDTFPTIPAKGEAALSQLDLFREVIAPCSTLVLSIAALAISWSSSAVQSRLAEAKLDFDLFGRRYEIYHAARSLIDRVKKHDEEELPPAELRALGHKIEEARFFFDRPTQVFLREIWDVSDRIMSTRHRRWRLNGGSDEAQWLALGKELSIDDARLSELDRQFAPTFERAMALAQLMRARVRAPREGGS
jgi:hypothetical protein